MILDTANCFNSFVPLRIYFSLASPSPRSSLPWLPSYPYRCVHDAAPFRQYELSSRCLRAALFLRRPRRGVPPHVLDATPPSLRSPLLPDAATPPSGLPKEISLRKTDEQLHKLNEEIDAVAAKIDAEKAEWKKANSEDKPVYQKSIDVLNSRLERLISHRRELSLAGIAAPVPAPGKSTPCMNVVPCAVDAALFVCIGD